MDPRPLRILEQRPAGVDAFLLRLERPDWSWRAGQLVGITGRDRWEVRDYTICSGTSDPFLDVMYRLIPHGHLTPYLAERTPGDTLEVSGPGGRFTVRDPSRPLVFCATGTGIAPCRAFLRSHPGLNLTVLHGVRTPEDLYFREEFRDVTYHPFCSREPLDGVRGRLTEALPSLPLPERAAYYLCGANEMIYEAEEILQSRGVDPGDMYHEPYYYRAYDEDGEVKKHSR